MSYLLFPGRHLVNTVFQADYLRRLLTGEKSALKAIIPGRAKPATSSQEILFALTSANQENSRFNPIPFHVRAIGVDRFARGLQAGAGVRYRIFGIPHYGHTASFAGFTIKEIADQSEQAIRLSPENCLVLCSTPEVIRLYQALGYSIAPAESAEPKPGPVTPIEIIREIGDRGESWRAGEKAKSQLAPSHQALFDDFPEIPKRIARLYQDPLTNQEGSLTSSRNYSTYARGMNEIIRLKYLDIRDAIKPGRIVDEGCADGALLAEISQDYPDADLFGIDLSAEFAGRFHERQRAGEFGGAYVHFFHRNLLDRLFEPDSIDTTICNSTLHELWSYAEQEKTVRGYLAEKFRQLRPGGRLVIRDVVGPEAGERPVFLHCNDRDGANPPAAELWSHQDRSKEWLESLSTLSRFLLFSRDFLPRRHAADQPAFEYRAVCRGDRPGFVLSRRLAAEFISKKDYTDNWRSELNEEFCFWSFSQWKSALTETGFVIQENPNQPAAGSRVYTNPWIVKNRFEGHVALFESEAVDSASVPMPPTNLVLVAGKP